MGWRFRRSVKILPGMRLNVGKRSLGLSAGPRGAKVSVNTRGELRRSAGIPGTGLSYTEQRKLGQGDALDELLEAPPELLTPEERHYVRGRLLRRIVGWGSALLIFLLITSGYAYVGGYLIIPAIILTIIAPWLARWI